MAGIVGLTELQHTSGNSALSIDESGNLTVKTGTTIVKGEGTATTNLQQGLAKVWINFDGQSTIATRDSHNVSGISDDGTGTYTTSYTSNMASVNYSASGSHNRAGLSSTTFVNDSTWAATTGGIASVTANSSNAAIDCDAILVSILGDLA
jgi:hypothetical protein